MRRREDFTCVSTATITTKTASRHPARSFDCPRKKAGKDGPQRAFCLTVPGCKLGSCRQLMINAISLFEGATGEDNGKMGDVPDDSGPLLHHPRNRIGGDAMRRDDLMKPDLFSDAL